MESALSLSVVFHVSQHPLYPDFWQCVSFGFFSSQAHETLYNLFCVFAMYFIPLLVIITAYTCIMWEIVKKTRETKECKPGEERVRGRLTLRRSDMANIERARSRTLRMTVTIVFVFIWCWTPYVVMTLWYMFDRESAIRVDSRIQDAFFIMAVSNSCMNPLVYGSYAMNFRRECRTCFCYLFHSHDQLQRKSTDAAHTRGVLYVPKCVLTLVKAGSGATRSTGVTGYAGSLTPKNQLTLNKRNLRPVSAEHLVVRGRISEQALDSEEFHSDPGAHGVYMVAS
ncbi:gonadotropin-releasing hormone II receptor-like [Cimex lectularius]|uniref:G-protein coupled receptors family 1 profile domain-containing protein n=1 Tax=Cimex lectularius TaxID=79782 RepID=A0A8I6SHD3_CIMLE|nr:gonadotropin-releasing hormone II receptor-like [Cimex lectularius]